MEIFYSLNKLIDILMSTIHYGQYNVQKSRPLRARGLKRKLLYGKILSYDQSLSPALSTLIYDN
ncbi:MAG: hypothetical protein ACMUIP_03990 [bacterium]